MGGSRFYLPGEAHWSTIQSLAKQDDIALRIDTALHTVEKTNKSLRGALPDNYFSRLGLDTAKLASLIDSISDIDTIVDKEEDVVGRVYEYFLGDHEISKYGRENTPIIAKCLIGIQRSKASNTFAVSY